MGGSEAANSPGVITPRATLDLIGKALSSGPVVDIACGEGEVLTFLAEREIDAIGLATDPTFVDRANACGLTAYQLPWSTYLEGLPGGCLAGIVASQRRLTIDAGTARSLCAAAGRALAPGGRLIVEIAEILDVPNGIQGKAADHPIADRAQLARCAQSAGLIVDVSTPDDQHESLFFARRGDIV